MSRSNESIINEFLIQYTHLSSDMGVLSNVSKGSIRREGFAEYSRFFCASIVFWCVYNFDDKEAQGSAIAKNVGLIREAFKRTILEVVSIKYICSGLIHSNSEYFR